MGRVLLYPMLFLVAVAACASMAVIGARVAAGARNRRQRTERTRALGDALWEPYTDAVNGAVVFGVQLVARWKGHTEIVRRDPASETVNDTDVLNLIQAKARVTDRAETYNSLHIQAHRKGTAT